MKAYVRFCSYLAELLLQREILQTKVAGKIKTHILRSVKFSRKSFLYDIMWKKTLQRWTGHRIRRMCFAYWITLQTYNQNM